MYQVLYVFQIEKSLFELSWPKSNVFDAGQLKQPLLKFSHPFA